MRYRSPRSAHVLGALFVAVVSLAACSKTSAPTAVGTNTNWLHSCSDDAECGDGDSCFCGVCTRGCSTTTQCDGLSETATCEALPGALCGEVKPHLACVQGCESDDDCAAITDGECTEGVCAQQVRVVSPAAGSGGNRGEAGAPEVDAGMGIPSTPSLTRDGAQVVIGPTFTACMQDADCTLVSISCDGCCGMGAIERGEQSEYDRAFSRACADYEGGICDCQPPDVVAQCERGFCAAVPRADVSDCFSPTQNVEHAYEPGAVGCPCEAGDADACVNPAALSCLPGVGTGRSAWVALDEGACGMRDPSCGQGNRYPTASECIASGADCYHLASGEFCGEGCIAELDCAAGGCPAYTPFTADDCATYQGVPVGEGVCGTVRWRSIQGGFVNTTEYWDLETGALLATETASDQPSFKCANNNAFLTYSGDLNLIKQCVRENATPVCGEQP